MKPTHIERAFLLRCGREWDKIARRYTDTGDFWKPFLAIPWWDVAVGRVPSIVHQIEMSYPPWTHQWSRVEDVTHLRKLAARCRTLAA
jgi:hypothetical protein